MTDHRLIVDRSGGWESIDFRKIADFSLPEPACVTVETAQLEVRCTDGELVFVPVRGNSGKFFDIYEFSRFLRRVMEDMGLEK